MIEVFCKIAHNLYVHATSLCIYTQIRIDWRRFVSHHFPNIKIFLQYPTPTPIISIFFKALPLGGLGW